MSQSVRPFLIDAAEEPDFILRWDVGDVSPMDAPVAFASPDRWELRRGPMGEEEVVFRSVAPWARLTVEPSFARGCIVRSPAFDNPWVVEAAEYPVAEYLTCRLAGRRGALHLHASSVSFDDGGSVFVGHSGAGKSTLAGLAERCGATVLSDDRTIVTIDSDGARAWGTPWHGSLRRTSADSAPVRALFLLAHGRGNRRELVQPRTALKELFVRLIQPRLHAVEIERTWEALERLVERVPVYRLEFEPTDAAMEVVRSARVRDGY